MFRKLVSILCVFGIFTLNVGAERHTVRFDNRCGHGTPHLLKDGKILSQGEEYISDGSFASGIAYLQTGRCNLNGEGCTLVEMTLINPTCPGCGSSVDISLIPPLAFSVPTSFRYFNGCEGQGSVCTSANCSTAFYLPGDNHVQVQCEENDVNLLVSFCAESSAYAKAEEATSSPALSIGAEPEVPKNDTVESTKQPPQSTETATSSSPLITPGAPNKRCSRSHNRRGASAGTRRSANFHRRHAKNRSGF